MNTQTLMATLLFVLGITGFGFSQFNNCDDFTTTSWPQNAYNNPGDTIGFTQNASLPITIETGALAEVNSTFPGIYLFGSAQFEMDGTNQMARFEIYGWYAQYSQMGFAVNGSSLYYMDDTFPLTIGNVTVDLDTSATNTGNWLNAYLTFSGPLNDVTIEGFESGILELCIAANPVSDCDDFTTSSWPQNAYNNPGDTIGFTQNASLPITIGTGVLAEVNGNYPGIYLLGPAQFEMDGTNQMARFEIYGWYTQYSQMGFAVNGSSLYYMDDTFPLTIGSVTVDLDTSATNTGNWTNAYLTFSGPLNEVTIEGFESGILELCIDAVAGLAASQDLIDFTVFPNPASETVTIATAKNINEVMIHSISGSTVQTVITENSSAVTIDVSDFKPGIYLITGKSNSVSYQPCRLVVE